MRKNNHKIKTCPFLDQTCLKNECGIYNENFERCEIGLLAYNCYLLSTVMKQMLDAESRIPKQ
jgi:hypothetical protein